MAADYQGRYTENSLILVKLLLYFMYFRFPDLDLIFCCSFFFRQGFVSWRLYYVITMNNKKKPVIFYCSVNHKKPQENKRHQYSLRLFVGKCLFTKKKKQKEKEKKRSVWPRRLSSLTAPFNNMRTLKFKAQPTNVFLLPSIKCSVAPSNF